MFAIYIRYLGIFGETAKFAQTFTTLDKAFEVALYLSEGFPRNGQIWIQHGETRLPVMN